MILFARIIGVLMVAMGVIFLLNPKAIKPYISFFLKGKRMCIGGVINIIMGMIFSLISSQCKIPGVIVGMGTLSLLKGLFILASGQEKMKSKIEWWGKRSPAAMRIWALVIIAIGVLFSYSI
ncbi:MAG: hypothetical protein QGI05_00855 [Candidatus Omnitrophota bacterium]|nr:hypothetical protein [Candidatus Omnitrophota bacterium]|tara:strand:- start:155 stop:520 length:366 start_codon:yes stop_codon:yes gene_type:complete